jgi:hypothetical protein
MKHNVMLIVASSLFALSTTGWFTVILSARGNWTTLRSRRPALPAQ